MALGFGVGWKNRLRDASYKGVKFKVLSSDTEIGRRNVLHQYPFQEEAFLEDLGQDADQFSIEAFVIQSSSNLFNYFTARDKLIKVLKDGVPGKLIHPFLGEKFVGVLGKAKISESLQEGGIARFSIRFVETTKNKLPGTLTGEGLLDGVIGDAINSYIDWFADKYDTVVSGIDDINAYFTMARGLVGSIRGTIGNAISRATALVNDASDTLASVVGDSCGIISTVVDGFDSFKNVAGLSGNKITQTYTTACTGTEIPVKSTSSSGGVFTIGGGISDITEDLPDPLDDDSIDPKLGQSLVSQLREMAYFGEEPGSDNASSFGGTLTPVVILTETSALEAKNQKILVNSIRSVAILNSMLIASRIKYTSSDEVLDVLSEIETALQDLLDKMGADATDTDLAAYGLSAEMDTPENQLRKAWGIFKKRMQILGGDLSNVIDYQVSYECENSLTLAHARYNDLSRSLDIEERNASLIRHPGFLPGGEILRILNA